MFHLVEFIVEAVRILQEKRIVALVQTKPVKAESARVFMFVVLKKRVRILLSMQIVSLYQIQKICQKY